MNKNFVLWIIVAMSFAVSAWFYPKMPQIMATHWGIDGQANGYMDKFWGLFLLPVILALTAGLMTAIPKIDPLKNNIAKFRGYYDNFLLFVAIFFLYLHGLAIAWNMGREFDMGKAIIPAMTAIFWFAGILMEKSKRNWFIGIRTPWTISDDAIWDKTNKLAAKIFKTFAVAGLAAISFGAVYFVWLVFALVAASIYLVAYSYFLWREKN
jgi:uncharacterized membrane protein